MKRSTLCLTVFAFVIIIVSVIDIALGIYNLNYYFTYSNPEYLMLAVLAQALFGLGTGIPLFLLGLFLFLRYRKIGAKWNKVTRVALSHEEISLEEISNQSGVPVHEVRDIILDAISTKTVKGSIKDDIFYRAERYVEPTAPAVEKVVEREVMVTRRVPETCFKCGASIKPDEASWLGPDNVECPHCGASLKVTTERV